MTQRVNILGVGISAINMAIALTTIENWILHRESQYVCVTPVHSVMECQNDPALRKIFNRSGLTTPDGMPLVWLCRLLGHRHVERVYGPDLMLALCDRSVSSGFRHYFYGGRQGVAQELADKLARRYPGLQVAGTHSPPFRRLTPEEDAEIVRRINAANSDIVWVGLGSPKQERWMAAHIDRINASVLIGVGAAFDFHTGVKVQAPHWMQRSGLEWFFRLVTEPRRLWRRYLVNNPLFLMRISTQLLGIQKYSLNTTEE